MFIDGVGRDGARHLLPAATPPNPLLLLQQHFQIRDAVVRAVAVEEVGLVGTPIGIYGLFTPLAKDRDIDTLLINMILHITPNNAEPAPLDARLQLLAAHGYVLQSLLVGTPEGAVVHFAAEFEAVKVGHDVLVYLDYPDPTHAILALAHFGAVGALLSPGGQAVGAEQRVAVLALLRILHYHGANRAQKVIETVIQRGIVVFVLGLLFMKDTPSKLHAFPLNVIPPCTRSRHHCSAAAPNQLLRIYFFDALFERHGHIVELVWVAPLDFRSGLHEF